jgi:hypothetical protein
LLTAALVAFSSAESSAKSPALAPSGISEGVAIAQDAGGRACVEGPRASPRSALSQLYRLGRSRPRSRHSPRPSWRRERVRHRRGRGRGRSDARRATQLAGACVGWPRRVNCAFCLRFTHRAAPAALLRS